MNEKEIERAFLDNDCRIAECTGLAYAPFKRIVEFGYNLALKDVRTEILAYIEMQSGGFKELLQFIDSELNGSKIVIE